MLLLQMEVDADGNHHRTRSKGITDTHTDTHTQKGREEGGERASSAPIQGDLHSPGTDTLTVQIVHVVLDTHHCTNSKLLEPSSLFPLLSLCLSVRFFVSSPCTTSILLQQRLVLDFDFVGFRDI